MQGKVLLIGREVAAQFRRAEKDEDNLMQWFSRNTPVVLVFLAVIITPKQFLGSPLGPCWNKISNSGSMNSYILKACLINGTFIVPPGQRPEQTYPAESEKIRWPALTPFIFLFQTVPFIVVRLIWSTSNTLGGIEVASIVKTGNDLREEYASKFTNKRTVKLMHIVNNILKVDSQKKRISKLGETQAKIHKRGRMMFFSSLKSNYLSNLVLGTKFLYLLAIIINVNFVTAIIGRGFLTMGVEFWYRMAKSEKLTNYFPEMFPLRVGCRVYPKQNMIIKPQFVQCLMTMNIYNEKVFLALWYWYFLSVLYWIIDIVLSLTFRFSYQYRLRTFKAHLPIPKNKKQAKEMQNLFEYYLSVDSCHALKLMSVHLDNFTMCQIVGGLHEGFLAEEELVRANQDVDINLDNSSSFSKEYNDDDDPDADMRMVAN